jgi:hypothetical protein
VFAAAAAACGDRASSRLARRAIFRDCPSNAANAAAFAELLASDGGASGLAEALSVLDASAAELRSGDPIRWILEAARSRVLLSSGQPSLARAAAADARTAGAPSAEADHLEACAALGVPNQDCFRSVDLFEGKDLRAVVRNIHALGRVAQSLDCFNGPILGAKIAEKKERAATRRATTSPQSVIIECPASQEQEDVDPQGPQTPVRSKMLNAAQSMGVSHLSRPRRSALSIMPSSYLPQIGFSSSYLKRKIGRVKFAADAAEPPSVCSPASASRWANTPPPASNSRWRAMAPPRRNRSAG